MAPSTFSLLNAILKADGSPHVPDLWRSSLLRDHMDSESRSAVAQTCQPGLRWLLTEWQSPALHVPVRASSAEQDPRALLRRMQGARRQLNKFSALHAQPVTLVLEQEGTIAASDKWWLTVFAALSGPRLPNFTLSLQLQHIPAPLLPLADLAFAGLEAVRLVGPRGGTGCDVQLPPPQELPRLRDLTIDWVTDACEASLWEALRPYVPQLQALDIQLAAMQQDDEDEHSDADGEGVQPYTRPMWSLAITGVTAIVLTRLTVYWDLEPWLARLLQRNAPVLKHLTVTALPLPGHEQGRVDNIPPVCSWTHLTLNHAISFCAGQLQWLPLPFQGPLVVDGPYLKSLEVDVPILDTVTNKLARVDIKPRCNLRLKPPAVPAAEQPHALRTALPHLTRWQAPDTELAVCSFTMSAALGPELLAAADLWPSMSIEQAYWPDGVVTTLPGLRCLSLRGPLTNTLLAQVRQSVSWADEVCVPRVRLETAVAQGGAFPWGCVHVQLVTGLSDWLRQALLAGKGVVWQLAHVRFDLGPEMDAVQAASMAEQLRRVTISGLRTMDIRVSPDVPVPANDQSTVLHHGLQVISALPCTPEHLRLLEWTATHELVSELRHLPHWRAALSLELESCPDTTGPPWPMSRLPWLIPRSYTRWYVSPTDVNLKEMESFLLCTPANRTRNEPLAIAVKCYPHSAYGALQTLKDRLEALGSCYPHVTFTNY